MKGLLLAAGAAIGLSACAGASPEEVTPRLQQATAVAIKAPDASAISIANPERFPAKWQWRATLDGRTYVCDADNLMRLPSCTASES